MGFCTFFCGKECLTFFLMMLYLLLQIPNWVSGEFPGATDCNPFPLPDAYLASLERNVCPTNFADYI